MNIQNYDLEIKRVSDLPEIDNPEGFWIFGSKSDGEGKNTSVKYPFTKLENFVKNLQLERRIALSMERTEQTIPIGEDMTVYTAKTQNVRKLEISVTGRDEWTEIPSDGQQCEIQLSADVFNYTLRVEPDVEMFSECLVYLFGKVKQLKL